MSRAGSFSRDPGTYDGKNTKNQVCDYIVSGPLGCRDPGYFHVIAFTGTSRLPEPTRRKRILRYSCALMLSFLLVNMATKFESTNGMVDKRRNTGIASSQSLKTKSGFWARENEHPHTNPWFSPKPLVGAMAMAMAMAHPGLARTNTELNFTSANRATLVNRASPAHVIGPLKTETFRVYDSSSVSTNTVRKRNRL